MTLRILLIVALTYFFISPIYATSSQKPLSPPIKRVIYVTFDGTRWQDIFLDHPYFPKLWGKYAKDGNFYGVPDSHNTMEVASVPISMPSYQSQMAGTVQPCDGNGCGRIQVETVAEHVLHQLKLNKKDVAIFASWSKINLAAEKHLGTTFTNTGNALMFDPDTHLADEVMTDLNQKQIMDNPGFNDRYDKYTFAQALHYLEKYQPRFLWISLLDADSAAHHVDLIRYQQALAFYDEVIDILITTLKKLNLDKETLVIITTDHGRGNGINWHSHGPHLPESKQTWTFVMNGELKPISQDGVIHHYNTLSIRPTIEAALGLPTE